MTRGGIDRREFLKSAAATMGLLLSANGLSLAEAPAGVATGAGDDPVPGPPVKFGVIGLGQWGKEIVTTLAKMPSAQVTVLCDTYQPFLDRAAKIAANATSQTDYRKLLESPDVEAVVIATPTHLHKEIALAAIQAGKHVYCEAPLAVTVEDSKAIALAGKDSGKVFQVGLQGRSNKLYKHVSQFLPMGALGNIAQVQAQWNKKQSWRRPAPTPEREQESNWRLSRQTAAGLMGEIGIHQVDLTNWYLNGLPTAVHGYGGILQWKDGREVPDTIHCVFEYPKDVRMLYSATLANSFSSQYTLFEGSDSALMMREKRGWMIREVDAPLLGWEPYARKEPCFDETGICMIADATKILQSGKEPGKEGSVEPAQEPLYCALENFTRSIRSSTKPACGALEGYQAAVAAIKANEAVLQGTKVALQSEWFELK